MMLYEYRLSGGCLHSTGASVFFGYFGFFMSDFLPEAIPLDASECLFGSSGRLLRQPSGALMAILS
jgi:hypothetical protein